MTRRGYVVGAQARRFPQHAFRAAYYEPLSDRGISGDDPIDLSEERLTSMTYDVLAYTVEDYDYRNGIRVWIHGRDDRRGVACEQYPITDLGGPAFTCPELELPALFDLAVLRTFGEVGA